jgi:prepilin-type N-terminal cleavage/methylation domain-containing protein
MPNRRDELSAGFTIIEVLIVLAIAGMIMLIVFQAIPTLQRNSRNNQRKQDVAAILAAVSHWELNHSGNIPDPVSGDNYLQYTTQKLTYYNDPSSSININATSLGSSSGLVTKGPETNLSTVNIFNHQKCVDSPQGTSTNAGAGYDDIVALFAIETGSGVNSQCQQL